MMNLSGHSTQQNMKFNQLPWTHFPNIKNRAYFIDRHYLVPTDATGVERYQQRIQRALDAKVKIAFGSDLYYYNAQVTRGQMAAGSYQAYKASGMSNLQILQSATMHPGVLLTGEGKIGLLQNGYFADIIAVEENPLENIRTLENVVFVMKGGEVIKDVNH
jgi:imidazolonepropionase-like amidohydrolase